MRRCYNFRNRQGKLFCKFPVPFIVSRNRHDRSETVSHQHVIGNPDRNLFSVGGIYGVSAGKDSALLLIHPPVQFGLERCLFAVRRNIFFFIVGGYFVHKRMFGSENHVGCAENCVGTGGEHADLLRTSGDGEINFGSFRTADPVFLHLHGGCRPVERRRIIQQTFAICRNPHHPLTHRPSFDCVSFLHPFVHFLVREHRAERLTPVDRNFGDVRQTEIL